MASGSDFTTEQLLSDLFKCVSVEALKNENIQKYDLKIYGTEDKIEQYGSDIAFVDISAENFNEERRDYNLVLKYGHTQKNVRNKVPIRDGFKREIVVYTRLIPCYQRFQQEKNIRPLDFIPKCFLTKYSDTDEIIVLENLKSMGYETQDRHKPMNLSQIKLVLEAYAEWHALSFALEDQKDPEYLEITKSFRLNPWKPYFQNQLGEMIDFAQQSLYAILEQNGETTLLEKYRNLVGCDSARIVLTELMSASEDTAVILHGDCWNNNFLFKCEDNDAKKTSSAKVAMFDFQMSSIRSPVFDLSHFIYSVASDEELLHFIELMEHYYFHLSQNLTKLGSDPEKIFPFETLILHWKKYSAYGAVLCPFIMMYCFIDKQDMADFGVCQTLKNATLKIDYIRRTMAVAKHFVECDFLV
ncbi:uncharacterized protein LOC126742931 [Anthonomus grandis grandis]|uniref:uncharacterized protein LOC126742931 n=1 Tax=Anthonomus grandis grandis TaxID=2921223 RepID=UPI0021669771|nr:uncharacterized protein LOC126742931 [Anthonomus grandis grandis]